MFLYRWTIDKIHGLPESGGMANVVAIVEWELEIRDTEDHSIHYIRESTQLQAPSPNAFIDHLELDTETILSWVWNIVGKQTKEQQITDELNAMRAPQPTQSVVQLSMPWMASCCPDGTGVDQDPVSITTQSP